MTVRSGRWFVCHKDKLNPEYPCVLGARWPGTHWSLLGAFLSWSAVTLHEKLKKRMAFSK